MTINNKKITRKIAPLDFLANISWPTPGKTEEANAARRRSPTSDFLAALRFQGSSSLMGGEFIFGPESKSLFLIFIQPRFTRRAPAHQILHRISCRLAFMQDGMNLRGDWHFDAIAVCETNRRCG